MGGGFAARPGFGGRGFAGRPPAVGEFGGWHRGYGRRGNVYIAGGYPWYGGYYDWPYYYGDYPYNWDYSYGEPGVVYGTPYVERRVTVYTHGGGIAEVQRMLKHEGFYTGSIDGIIGPETRAAIRAFQASHGLRVTGRIDASLMHSLR